jgi:integrase
MHHSGTTLDLFAETPGASLSPYCEAMASWLAEAGRAGRLQRDSSVDVYDHMWSAMAAWAVGNGVGIDELSANDLDTYLATRGGADELSNRYAWRLLRLVDRVMQHRARVLGAMPNHAAAEALARRPELRFANAHDKDPLPAFLPAAEAKVLVTYLSAVRTGRTPTKQPWQEVRNRAAVALMLGAGITPGEVRALELEDVTSNGGRSKNVPWKLQVKGNGNAAARETPIAPWAGQLLRYWLDIRSEQQIPGNMLFPSTRSTGKPWGKVAQYNAAREVLTATGIEDIEGGSFRLRHTFALRQLRRGKTPLEVARWLGVTDPAVMSRYQRVLTSPIDVV